ncbi:MAG: hypothetical protein EZS28_039658, partial [Streblomastix strix]
IHNNRFLSVVYGSSGIRGICCCGYAGIGGINRLCTLLIDRERKQGSSVNRWR